MACRTGSPEEDNKSNLIAFSPQRPFSRTVKMMGRRYNFVRMWCIYQEMCVSSVGCAASEKSGQNMARSITFVRTKIIQINPLQRCNVKDDKPFPGWLYRSIPARRDGWVPLGILGMPKRDIFNLATTFV